MKRAEEVKCKKELLESELLKIRLTMELAGRASALLRFYIQLYDAPQRSRVKLLDICAGKVMERSDSNGLSSWHD